MKITQTFSIAVIAFAIGAFLPYFYLNGKIEEVNSKMGDMMEYVNYINGRIDYNLFVDNVENDANTLPGYASSVWDQKLFKLTIVDNEKDRQITSQVKSAN